MTSSDRINELENQLRESNQRLDSQLVELRQQQEINTSSIVGTSATLSANSERSRGVGLNQAVQGLVEVARIDRELAREDRAAIREMQAEIRGLQLECQRIWEYLLSQQGNGNRPS
ncbi:MAG: hypothetical protein AAFO04_24095 [Cyanobacteria bacterium J06592_8]